MTTETANAEMSVLDATGLNCPLPILRTKKAIGGLASGTVLKVLTTDPGSVEDIASFCRQTGHELLSSRTAGGTFEFEIRRG
ncbi:MAG: sulfurtransferase TusA family protein [Hyphomicrobiales bacterium]